MENSNNPFAMDSDYSTSHKVESGDVLGGIIDRYYGGSGLDLRFVQLAIIAINRKYSLGKSKLSFAGPTLKLPSVRKFKI